MWDFSWLLRREGDTAEYADVERVLDELAERGYDTVRIDAFPHLIAADEDGAVLNEHTVLPQPPGFMWGNHAPTTVEPLRELLRFVSGVKERGLRVGLSTWFTPDTNGRAQQVSTPEDLGRIWIETLRHLESHELLDAVEWVDLCNEWPAWAPGVMNEIFGPGTTPFSDTTLWTDEQVAELAAFDRSLEIVAARFPELPLTLSYYQRGPLPPLSREPMRLSTAGFGIGEPHLWLSTSSASFMERTRYEDNYSDDTHNLLDHEKLVRERYDVERDAFYADFIAVLDEWRDWAAERRLPLYTTEGWASVGWSPDLVEGWTGWEYVRDVAETVIPLVIERGWTGICTSNFSQPHFAGMWGDAAWHRRMTDLIHS